MRAAGPLVAALVLLGACGPQQPPEQEQAAAPAAVAPAPAPASPPAEAADFTRGINLLGNEPFWAMQIRDSVLTFSAPDQQEQKAYSPGPRVTGNRAEWTADGANRPMRATLTAVVCQDGMSGLLYPFKAVVEVDGRVLEGCGAYADAMPREAP